MEMEVVPTIVRTAHAVAVDQVTAEVVVVLAPADFPAAESVLVELGFRT